MAAAAHVGVEGEDPFEVGHRVVGVRGVAGVFLAQREFDAQVRVRKAAKHRRHRFTRLEVPRAVLALQEDVLGEVTILRLEQLVSLLGAVRVRVLEASP